MTKKPNVSKGLAIAFLFPLISCQESVTEEQSGPETEQVADEKIAPEVAFRELKNSLWGSASISDTDVTKYCNCLTLEWSLRLLRVTGTREMGVGNESIFLGNLERLGELDHRIALEKIHAHSPEDLAVKGHPLGFTSGSVSGLKAILRGWARIDVAGAYDYALNLAKQEDEINGINWDYELSEGSSQSFVEVCLKKRLPEDSQIVFLSLLEDLPFWWSKKALRSYASHCDLSGDKLKEFEKLKRLIAHTERSARKWAERINPNTTGQPDIGFESVHLCFGNNWARVDFHGALEWWLGLEELGKDLAKSDRIEWLFRSGVGASNEYQRLEMIKWMQQNVGVWSDGISFGYILAHLQKDQPSEVLDLIFDLPKGSKRARILANLIVTPENDFLRPWDPTITPTTFLEIRTRMEQSNFSEQEIAKVHAAFEKQKSFENEKEAGAIKEKE